MSQYPHYPPSRSLPMNPSPSQKPLQDSYSTARMSKYPEPDHTITKAHYMSNQESQNYQEKPKKSPPMVLNSDLDSLKYRILPEETGNGHDRYLDGPGLRSSYESDPLTSYVRNEDLETVPERSIESEMTYKNSILELPTSKNSFKVEMEDFFPNSTRKSEQKASTFKSLEGLNTTRTAIDEKIKVVENLKQENFNKEEIQGKLNSIIIELEAFKVETKKMKNDKLNLMEENEKMRENAAQLEEEIYFRRQEAKKMAEELKVMRQEKEGFVRKWQIAEKDKEELERINEILLRKNKDMEKEFQMHVEEVSLLQEKKLEQKLNEMLMDRQHQFHTKEKKIKESSEKLRSENQTLKVQNEGLLRKIREQDQEIDILSNRKPEKITYTLSSPTSMKKLMDDLLSELDIKANSLEELHSEIAEFKNYYKQMNKFTELVLDMTANCHPSNYFQGNKPSLKQAWKWLKTVLEKYMVLKKSTIKNEEGLKNAMIAEEYNELVGILLENLHISKKSEIVNRLYQVVNENNVFNRMMPKVKKVLKIDKRASLKDVERKLDEIG